MNIYITVIIFLLVRLLGNYNSGVSDDRPLLSEPWECTFHNKPKANDVKRTKKNYRIIYTQICQL